MSNWLSSLATQAIEYVDSVTDSIVAQANDAQTKLIEEQTKLQQEQAVKNRQLNSIILLPWETEEESLAILSQDLMDHILALPLNELNFTTEPPNTPDVPFTLSEFIPVAMNLLKIDTNLASVHSKISPKMDEEIFWRNYYCRIAYLRAISGIEGADAKADVKKWEEGDIIYVPKSASANSDLSARVKSNISNEKSNASKNSDSIIESAGEIFDSGSEAGSNNKADDVGPLDDLDDMDLLEELGDLDDEDFEEIGKSEYTGTSTAGSGGADVLSNDELEAQIARELAEELAEDD